MKFEIGDKVIVKHTQEHAVVVEMLGDDMILLENDKGVRFPVFEDTIDHPYASMFAKKPKAPERKVVYIDQLKTEKVISSSKDRKGVEISFLPVLDKDVFDDDIVEKIKIYITNHNSEPYRFIYKYETNKGDNFTLENTVDAGKQFYLHDMDYEALNDSPKFEIEFSLKNPKKGKASHHTCFLKPSGKQLFKRIQDMLGKQEATFTYPLFDEYPDKLEEEVSNKIDFKSLHKAGFKVYEVQSGKKHLPPAKSVVDLHIDAIVDDPEMYKPDQILDIQLRTFETWYDIALGHQIPEITFIHGVGEGKLKRELHDRLKARREVKKIDDSYHPAYGHGATRVYFKKYS